VVTEINLLPHKKKKKKLETNINQLKLFEQKLDLLVFKLYDLSIDEIDTIMNYLKISKKDKKQFLKKSSPRDWMCFSCQWMVGLRLLSFHGLKATCSEFQEGITIFFPRDSDLFVIRRRVRQTFISLKNTI
jgi:hypothetical protein